MTVRITGSMRTRKLSYSNGGTTKQYFVALMTLELSLLIPVLGMTEMTKIIIHPSRPAIRSKITKT